MTHVPKYNKYIYVYNLPQNFAPAIDPFNRSILKMFSIGRCIKITYILKIPEAQHKNSTNNSVRCKTLYNLIT